ncbi:MAG: nitroreductase family protein [Isosphaeraceae bacterium]|nr:nitroreductase family protein [Isosphaeraceae bacterium]
MPTIPDRRVDGGPALSAPEAIAHRRATRRFDPARPVPDGALEQVLHLATLAPSGFNLQPWRFLVVRTDRNRQKLYECAFRQPKVAEAPVVVIVLGYHHPHRSHLDAMIEQQKTLGAIPESGVAELRARATRTMERVPDPALWATRSTMLAAATLMVAAESLGLASAPMEGFEPEKVKEAFGVPNDHSVCCLIALGFAAEEKPFPGRFGLAEVCFEEHFGQPWTLGESE